MLFSGKLFYFMPYKKILLAALIIFAVLTSSCNKYTSITQNELRDHISYLASDELKGRMTGSEGDSLAAEYIRRDLKSIGFQPIEGDGWQRFAIAEKPVPGPGNSLKTEGKDYIAGTDFTPLAFSSDDMLNAEVVFAGYGLNIKNDTLQWNDYSGIDIQGKWVLLLKSDPDQDNGNGAFAGFSADREKSLAAKDLGAGGILLVSGQSYDAEDKLDIPGRTDGYSLGIPVFRIKRNVADAILARSGKTVESLEKQISSARKPISFSTGVNLEGKAGLLRKMTGTRNIAMILPGEDPKLKNEYVVIGAHYDHLGMGGEGSSSRRQDTVAVHHGADDNASGVAMMLELAEKFAGTKGSHKRSIVCIGFSGEEMGLLGSKHFVDKSPIQLAGVNAMINLDMVGRLNEDNTLQVSGVGTAVGLKELVLSGSDTSVIKLALSDEGYGPSDHSSFYGKDIPVLFYFTGAHEDYHTPADTYDDINYDGMVTISGLIYNVMYQLVNADSTLSFREAGPKGPTVARMRGVTLGIMPDFAGVIKNGLRADFVTPGRPAALGGMKKGDIIVSIEGKPVNNIQDYMSRMQQVKAGQLITVDVLRNEKKVGLLIQL